jgi:hypothetical protein
VPSGPYLRPNEQRLSDAEPMMDERAGAAWRQINLVELNRRDGV